MLNCCKCSTFNSACWICPFYFSVNSLLVILQFEKDEKSNPLPPCRGWPFSAISCCSGGISPCRHEQILLNWCFPCSCKWFSLGIFQNAFLFQVCWTCFTHVLQMYEVALSAQNAERVKLEPFDGSKGYLHNGLYRDPKLPGILRWELISLMVWKANYFLVPQNYWI